MEKDLTTKQEAFAQEYVLNGFDGAKAYRKAYPKSKGYKDETVWASASRLLKNVKVMLRIEELKDLQKDKNNTVFTFTQKEAYDKLERIYNAGLEKEQIEVQGMILTKGYINLNAAKSAVDSQSKLYGLLTDKSETTHKGSIHISEQKISEADKAVLSPLIKKE